MGDDIFQVEDLGNNRIRLIPTPTHVSEPGTPVNKALLQPIEDYLATGVVPVERTITAGNGLTGGGSLTTSRTLSLGTPSTISPDTTNNVTSSSHTHAVSGLVPSTREIKAGTGLTGGGNLSADRTLSVKFGTTAGTVCEGNDYRLSNARTPTAHNHDDRYYTKSQLNTSGGGGKVHWNNVASKPSTFPPSSHTHGVGDLKKATGSTTATVADIQRYAFGSISWGGSRQIAQSVLSDRNYSSGYEKYRFVQFSGVVSRYASGEGTPSDPPSRTISWDYLTASGFPCVWAVVDDTGNIITMWEAEDPVDWEFPDECPIIDMFDDDGNSLIVPPGGEIIPLHFPTEEQLVVIQDELSKLTIPTFSLSGVWAKQQSILTPQVIAHTIFNNAMQERLLEPLPDIREALAVSDVYKRNWRLQLWLRAVSRVKKDHREFSLIPLYQEMFRADKRTGYLEMK